MTFRLVPQSDEEVQIALQEVIDSPYDFVIFDDPLYSIDAGHRRKALDEMFDFAKRTGKQLIIATHDPLFFHYLKEKLRFRHADFGLSTTLPQSRTSSQKKEEARGLS